MRTLTCVRCGNDWEEEVRSGQRPYICPACDPRLAHRRAVERAKKAHKPLINAEPQPQEAKQVVPSYLLSSTTAAVRAAVGHSEPGREELAGTVRAVHDAQGDKATRQALEQLAGCALAWASNLHNQIKQQEAA